MNITRAKNRVVLVSISVLMAVFSLVSVFSGQALAVNQLTARKVVLGSSVASAQTTYEFDFTTGSTATIQSFQAQACDTASGTCNTPTGFGITGSGFTSTTFSGSWSVNTSTAGSIRGTATGATSTNSGVAKQIIFNTVTNPSATNASFYLRLTTYSDAAWTTAVDTGVVVASTAAQVTVTASVDESLTFTLGSQTVPLGTLTTSTTGSGTSTMSAATNAGTGYSITVNGTTLTSGANTITALASQTASSQGSSQFGINLKANTTPSVGSNPSGGSGAATTNYGTANQFRFGTGEAVASASGASNTTSYTVSYIGNIDSLVPPGNYSTTLTYIASATF